MVVQVVEPSIELARSIDVLPMPEDRVDHFAHGEDDPTQFDQILSDPIGAQLEFLALRVVIEEAALERFNPVVHCLDRSEVPIHDDIEKSVHESAHAELEQIGVVLPALDHLGHVEVGRPSVP